MSILQVINMSSFINIGTQDRLSDFENRHIQLVNIVALTIMLACLAGIGLYLGGLFFYSDEISILQGAIPLMQMFVIFVVLHFNRVHEYDSAKLLLVLSSIITILSMGLLFQPESGNNFFFILGPLGIFLFLGLNNYAFSLVFFSFIMMLGILAFQGYYPAVFPIADSLLATNYIVSIVVVFVLIALMTFFLIQTNQAMEKRLVDAMETDALTGLYNRLKYNEFIGRATSEAITEKHPLSIIVIDIDFFKNYNDTYGHLEGDKILIALGNVLKGYGNSGNILVTRFGGEEFAIVLSNTSMQESVKIAENILEDVRTMAMPHKKSLIADIITCSIGIASVIPKIEDSISDIFGRADQKLYQAKNNGRNRIEH